MTAATSCGVLEESGLSMTQCKALLELGGLGQTAETWQVGDLAEVFGVSVPSMSRAVDGLVKKGLATRVEDPDDRRVRQVKITESGKDLVETLVAVRQNGMRVLRGDLERDPAPPARRRRRRADGSRGHRPDL